MNKRNKSKSLEQSHTPEAIQKRLERGAKENHLKDFVYGAIDGTVTTFAVISGVAGAGLSIHIIIIMGFANLLADGFSMGVSNFLGTRAANQHRELLRKEEHEHLKQIPEGEREEIRQIFKKKGFEGELLEKAVATIAADQERWVEMMLTEEHGFAPVKNSPVNAALVTFIAFLLVGLIPLLPFVFKAFTSYDFPAYSVSIILTAIAFFSVGAMKSFFVKQPWLTSGLETLALGGGAALIAYGVGVLLKGIVQ